MFDDLPGELFGELALGRPWSWPGRLVVWSFGAMILARLALAG